MKRFILWVSAALAITSCGLKDSNSNTGIETPTMGWSSWNTYRVHISDSLIMKQADAMVSTGLVDAGYRYINIDDGYFGGRDESSGQLLIHPTRFPKGLKPVVDHIHSLGLKAGIYSDAGYNTCGNYWDRDSIAVNVGLYGHEQQDADFFFKKLGFDFIKVDFCGGTAWQNNQMLALDPESRYRAIREAIDATGRKDIRLNVCRWDYPGIWVNEVASSWRISHDISSRWWSLKSIIGQSLYLSAYAGGGHYNDMDMLEVGRTLTAEEDKTHFGIWCIMSSPLLIGCDMTTLKPETFELLTNKELIALNQDPLGLQAQVVRHDGDTYVLVKDIEVYHGTSRAVAFYNPSDEEMEVGVDMSDLYLGGVVKVRDLFEHQDLAAIENGHFGTMVPAHGCRIYRLDAETRDERTLYEAEAAFLSAYQELYNPNVVCSGYYEPREEASGRMVATNLGATPVNDLHWKDVYSCNGGEYVITLRVFPKKAGKIFVSVNDGNGSLVTVDGAEGLQEVSFHVNLLKGNNDIRLYNDREMLPDVDCMTVVACSR